MVDNTLKDYLDVAVDMIVIGEALAKAGKELKEQIEQHEKRKRKKKRPRKRTHRK